MEEESDYEDDFISLYKNVGDLDLVNLISSNDVTVDNFENILKVS